MAKCNFVVQEVDLIGHTKTSKEVAHIKKSPNSWKNQVSTIQKTLRGCNGFLKILPKLYTQFGGPIRSVVPVP